MDRSWSKLLLCVILSASIWLVHNLTQDYPETESVTLQVRSSIEGRSVNAADDVVVTARCVTSGFRHIGLGSRSKPVEIEIDPADFEFVSGDTYRIPSANLYKYGSRIFGDGVSIESFASEGISVRFEKVSFRKVPVVPVLSVSYKPQYMAAGPMTLLPDSVGVYGEPGRIAGIDKVLTRSVNLRDLGKSGAHGKVKLDAPGGVRLSATEVAYSLSTSRFVELSSRFNVNVHGAPAGVELTVLPSTVEAVFRCVFPVEANPVDIVEFYVDYSDFTSSIGGRCMIRCSGIPAGVIDYRTDHEVVDCILQQ